MGFCYEFCSVPCSTLNFSAAIQLYLPRRALIQRSLFGSEELRPHRRPAREEFVLQKIRAWPLFSTPLSFQSLLLFVVFFFSPKGLDGWRALSPPPAGEERIFPLFYWQKEKLMARSIDSDYVDFSQMGGFDMGIDFDGFEENVKKLMELPIKYLDSAHDKAVEFIEDVQAIIFAPFPDDKVPNKEDQSSSNVMSGSSPVETGLVEQNVDVSTPESLVTEENSSTGCVDMGAHETESFSTTTIENTSSKGSHIEANDLCLLPEGTSKTEIYDSCTSEEVILWNPEVSVKSPRPLDSSVCCNGAIFLENPSVNYEEQMVLYSVRDPVGATMHEPTTVSQDNVHKALDTDQVTDQAGLHCSEHSDILVESAVFFGAVSLENSSTNHEEQTVLYSTNGPVEATTHGNNIPQDSSADVFSCANDPNMSTGDMLKFVHIDTKNGQGHTKNDNIEASPVAQLENVSFKKMFMRSLSSKLRWSNKQTNVHAMPFGSQQDPENLGYQVVSSSDDLEDDWEVL